MRSLLCVCLYLILDFMEGGVGKMTETQSDTVLWMAWLVVPLIVFCGTTFLSLSHARTYPHIHTLSICLSMGRVWSRFLVLGCWMGLIRNWALKARHTKAFLPFLSSPSWPNPGGYPLATEYTHTDNRFIQLISHTGLLWGVVKCDTARGEVADVELVLFSVVDGQISSQKEQCWELKDTPGKTFLNPCGAQGWPQGTLMPHVHFVKDALCRNNSAISWLLKLE